MAVTEGLSLDVGYRYHRVEELGVERHATDYDADGVAAGVTCGF